MGDDREWRFSQLFGEKNAVEEVSDVDIVSAIEFDETGNYLAVGDRGGRVVVFERSQDCSDYKFYAEFQSHEAEFDYLKSLEIEEKINKIRWSKRNHAHFLLTTNDKTIKLWKLFEKKITTRSEGGNIKGLHIPPVSSGESIVAATPRRVFSNAHAYHINAISLNSDGETFISADDLRINLWNLEISDQSFNVVDIKPPNMDELVEVITTADFHPQQCNTFMYSSSIGSVRLGDLRSSALCDQHVKLFHETEDPANSFFSEIITSISDCKFSPDGRYILARDYMHLKVWDLHMESKPIKTIKIHEQLRAKLCDLYENDCIFDKFECDSNPTGSEVLTGSYDNMFYIHNWEKGIVTSFEANKNFPKSKIKTTGVNQKLFDANDAVDFNKKCLHLSWHPKEDFVAIGASNNLFLYEKSSADQMSE